MDENLVLVVDDDSDFRDLITCYLEEEGFETMQAESGVAALDLIATKKPGLILLDIVMPCMNGLDVCRILKSQAATSDIPIIMVTATISLSHKIAGYLAGARRYLCKPFALDELGECIRNVMHLDEAIGESGYRGAYSNNILVTDMSNNW